MEKLNFLFELVDLGEECGILQKLGLHQSVRGNDGGVISLKDLCNTWERHFGKLTDQINGNMSCVGNILVSLVAG